VARAGAMIKRTIEISREPARLSVHLGQLVLKRGEAAVVTIPCEDIGMVIVDHPQTTYTHAALATLLEAGAVVVVCGAKHLPIGLLLPLADHTQVVWRMHDQIAVSRPLRKCLWQQVVQAKIRAQARNLVPRSPQRRKLEDMALSVKSGDPSNLEAQAARVYWAAWMEGRDGPTAPTDAPFRRDPDGDGVNALLNYGYAVVRAALARALIAAGLHPALGLQHSNRSNAFCLADDLIEPLRPLVDARARRIVMSGRMDLDRATKAELLELLTLEVEIGGVSGPLMVSLHRYVASLVRCYEGGTRVLEVPTRCNSASTEECGS
jgi:CRISPR-associated protein Cas1